MFERFYRTGTIGDGYTLRPVESYTAAGRVYRSARRRVNLREADDGSTRFQRPAINTHPEPSRYM
jgi:hypothetical protein